MHFRAVATRFWQRAIDVFLVVFGFAAMAYTTTMTVRSWVAGGQEKAPGYCDEQGFVF